MGENFFLHRYKGASCLDRFFIVLSNEHPAAVGGCAPRPLSHRFLYVFYTFFIRFFEGETFSEILKKSLRNQHFLKKSLRKHFLLFLLVLPPP